MSIEDLIEDYIKSLSDQSNLTISLEKKRLLIIDEIMNKYGRLFTYIECDELVNKSNSFNILIKNGDVEKILQVASLRLCITR